MWPKVIGFGLGALSVVVAHDLFVVGRRLVRVHLSNSRGSLYSHG